MCLSSPVCPPDSEVSTQSISEFINSCLPVAGYTHSHLESYSTVTATRTRNSHRTHSYSGDKAARMHSNINDPTAVKALLDQLRASQAWQDTLNSSSSHVSSAHQIETLETLQDEPNTQPSDIAPSASVASLLSQLRATGRTSITVSVPPVSDVPTVPQSSQSITRSSQGPPPTQSEHRPARLVASASSTYAQDIRSMSFQQALPHLTQLASDPGFLAAVSRLRQDQNELEQQLWEERQAIHKKHEEKVKVARTKATLIGAGLSKHETDTMNDAYRRDLQRFDRERVLLAWDAHVQKQQLALESLGVPTMCATTSQADCQKQRRVAQVLEGL